MPEVKDFDVRDISKSGLNLRDLKHLNKDSNVVTKNDVDLSEAKLYGTSKRSYQNLENVRIIARHSKPILDDSKPGARSRNVESFYIENSQGERFRLPEGTSINGARAYARHVKNGGQMHDDFGKHIGTIIKEMNDLRIFVRNMRGRTFEDLETHQIVETAIDHYGKLHSDLFSLRSQKGYDQYRSLWHPEILEEDEFDLESLKERFVKRVFDERITNALPIVFKEYNKRKRATEQEFNSWASNMIAEYADNPLDKDNHNSIQNSKDLEEDETEVNVKSPFANSLKSEIRDSEDNQIDGDDTDHDFSALFNEQGFVFRFNEGIYYFESKDEVERAKDWISYKYPKRKFPEMGVFDYGYGVHGSTTFDRELPGGKGVMESKKKYLESINLQPDKELPYYLYDEPEEDPIPHGDQNPIYNINWIDDQDEEQIDIENLDENLRKWFKEKWVRFGPDGKIQGDCARGDESEGKPKCLPQSKAHSLGKKGRASAAARKRREDTNPERSGKAINVATKKKTNESMLEGQHDQAAEEYRTHLIKTMPQMTKFFDRAVKGWRPSEDQMMAAIETAYTVMKHTGDKQQAGKALMDELNTLHRMSQGQQGVAEKMSPRSHFAGKWKLGSAAHLKGKMKRPAQQGDLVGDAESINKKQIPLDESLEKTMGNFITLLEKQNGPR